MSFDDWRGSPKREAGQNFGPRSSALGTSGRSTYQAGGGAADVWGSSPSHSSAAAGGGGYGSGGYGGNGGSGGGGGGDDPMTFQRASQKVQSSIQEINQNVSQITKLVQIFGVPGQDSLEVRQRLNHLVTETGSVSKNAFKDVAVMSRLGKSNSQNRSIMDRLNNDFNRAMEDFQEIAKVAQSKEKSVPVPAAPKSRGGATAGGGRGRGGDDGFQLGEGIPFDEDQSAFAQRQKQALMLDNELEFNDALIQERDKGVREIERTMNDVQEIFVHMANLVHEQGVMVDNIESHIDSAVADTSKGVYELRQAEVYQKSARTKTCLILIVLLVVVCIVIVLLVLGVTLGLKWSDVKDKF